MASKKAPISKANNAHELLRDVCRVILEEPKRVYMPLWVTRSMATFRRRLREDSGFDYSRDKVKAVEGPECGLIGCIGGWTVILARQTKDVRVPGAIQKRATEILLGEEPGMDFGEAYYWTYDRRRDALHQLFGTTDIDAVYGTKKYARLVVGHIKDFMRINKTALVARKL